MSDVDGALAALGLSRGVTWAEIKQAHRDLTKVWHPDRFENDKRLRDKAEEELKNINVAFEVLAVAFGRGTRDPFAASEPPFASSETAPPAPEPRAPEPEPNHTSPREPRPTRVPDAKAAPPSDGQAPGAYFWTFFGVVIALFAITDTSLVFAVLIFFPAWLFLYASRRSKSRLVTLLKYCAALVALIVASLIVIWVRHAWSPPPTFEPRRLEAIMKAEAHPEESAYASRLAFVRGLTFGLTDRKSGRSTEELRIFELRNASNSEWYEFLGTMAALTGLSLLVFLFDRSLRLPLARNEAEAKAKEPKSKVQGRQAQRNESPRTPAEAKGSNQESSRGGEPKRDPERQSNATKPVADMPRSARNNKSHGVAPQSADAAGGGSFLALVTTLSILALIAVALILRPPPPRAVVTIPARATPPLPLHFQKAPSEAGPTAPALATVSAPPVAFPAPRVVTKAQFDSRFARLEAQLAAHEKKTGETDKIIRASFDQAKSKVAGAQNDAERREAWKSLDEIEAQL